MILHDFNDSIVIGGDGEDIIFNLLQSLPTVESVKNVSGVPEYMSKDIDFIVQTKKKETIFYELKTEPKALETGNLFFEFISNESRKTPGCFVYSEADYWISFIPQTGDVYIFLLDDCRKYINEIKPCMRMKRVHNIVGNSSYYSLGYAVKITDICNNIKFNYVKIDSFSST